MADNHHDSATYTSTAEFFDWNVRFQIDSDRVKRIYNALSDDHSHRIFRRRLGYSLTNDMAAIGEIIRDMDGVLNKENLLRLLVAPPGQDRGIVIYGAADCGRRVKETFSALGFSVICFCEYDQRRVGAVFEGAPVVSVETAAARYGDRPVLVASPTYTQEMYDHLLQTQYPPDNIVICLTPSYFEPWLPHSPEEVFVDVGAFNGRSSLDFMKWSGGLFKHIYLFEPDPRNMALCQKNLGPEHGDKITYVEAGLWHSRTELRFLAIHSTSSLICEQGQVTVPVVSLDEFLAGSPATFIKIDIEGAEMEALQGARRTIEKHRPKLAIAIYHKPRDIIDLPAYIQELVPDYTFTLRHYSLYEAETILYAVPARRPSAP